MINNQDTLSRIDGIRKRIKVFILDVIGFAKEIPKDDVGRVLVNQLLRSATSVGANYEEASEAQTSKDIIYKLSVVKKEAKESIYWLELVCDAYPAMSNKGNVLMQENLELIKIFSSIIAKRKLH